MKPSWYITEILFCILYVLMWGDTGDIYQLSPHTSQELQIRVLTKDFHFPSLTSINKFYIL